MAKKEYIDRRSLGIKCADPSVFINPAYAMGWNIAVKLIQNAPVADVAPVRHGFWVKEMYTRDEYGNPKYRFCCSNCGRVFDRTAFCGGCGAKMDGGNENA